MRSVNISGNLRGNQVLLISLVHYMAKLHFFFSPQRYGLWFSLKSAIHFFANHLGKVSIRLGKFSLQLINLSILMSCWLNNVIIQEGEVTCKSILGFRGLVLTSSLIDWQREIVETISCLAKIYILMNFLIWKIFYWNPKLYV